MNFRALAGTLNLRNRLAELMGLTFKGARDLYKALGYQRELSALDYRARFDRNEVANRVVKAVANATWRGGAEVWEDQDPNVDTPFEQAFEELNARLNIWDVFRKTDILGRIGRYGIVLIGAPGELDQPLTSCGPDEIAYLRPYPEENAVVQTYIVDRKDPRYGQPEFYNVKFVLTGANAKTMSTASSRVHWTRVHHMADGLLEDRVFGEPALQCIWNRLDDLEKVAGGGPEAFWKRADGGLMFNLEDPTLEMDPASKLEFERQTKEYEHGLRKILLTQGLKAERLGSDVADISSTVTSLMSLISAGTGIPMRVLMGSEQAKLAAKMDRGNWDDRVSDRRLAYAGPEVKAFLNYLVTLGALPKPADDYEVRFPELKVLDDEQKATVANSWAGLNKPGQHPVVSHDEIRTRVLGLEPWDDVNDPVDVQPVAAPNAGPNNPLAAKKKKVNLEALESERWAPVHAAADRFRRTSSAARRERFLRGTKRVHP